MKICLYYMSSYMMCLTTINKQQKTMHVNVIHMLLITAVIKNNTSILTILYIVILEEEEEMYILGYIHCIC